MPPDRPVPASWSLAQRALACSKPRCRTLEQINAITDLLTYQALFDGLQREELLAVAYFIEAKHSEAGECVLSKGQPLEQLCLLLSGSALLNRYSAQPGAEQATAVALGPNDSWSEAGLLHSTHPCRSSITVVAGPQGCMTLRLRYSDYDAMVDLRNPMPLLPPDGTQGPMAVPEISAAQRRAASVALLCCCLRRLASARPADVRTPEEASELEPFLASLPACRHYPPELVTCLAAACRSVRMRAGTLVYEQGTLADEHVTVLSGEVQLRRLGGQQPGGGEAADSDAAATAAAAAASAGGGSAGGAAGTAAAMWPSPPPGRKPEMPGGPQQQEQLAERPESASGGRLNIRARLRREREARKLMQRQLDEYVSRMDADQVLAAGAGAASSSSTSTSTSTSTGGPSGGSPLDWTRIFMQKAMRTVEPVWKALHPADKAPKRRPRGNADTAFEVPLDGSEGPITEVAQLLGPAAAKAYYRGLQTQGYSDSESPPSPPPGAGNGGAGGGRGSGGARRGAADGSPSRGSWGRDGSVGGGDRWRRMMFSVDGPETDKERTLRNMAMRASRIYREQHARSRGSAFDAEEMDELYGTQYATLTRGAAVGELSTVMLHTTMRKESAIAGHRGCELLLVDWEAFQQGVLAARAAVLARAASFLGTLSLERLTHLAELCVCLSVESGTLVARQGASLECVVVVQAGEVSLLHEPSAATHTRISAVRATAISRSRNGRSQLVPLLATLSFSRLPGFSTIATTANASATAAAATTTSAAAATATAAAAAAAAAIGTTSPAGSGGSFTGALPAPPTTSGGSFTVTPGSPVEVTLHGLPLGEVGACGILGEAILGTCCSGSGAPLPPALPGSNQQHPDPSLMSNNGQGQSGGAGAVDAHQHHPQAAAVAATAASAADGPRWPATVLAARPNTVLLVLPRSVLYMSEFDLIRGDLVRFAAERRTWLARRVETAYRAAAALTTTPGSAPPPPPPQQQQSGSPLQRRPGLAAGSAAGDGGGVSGAAAPHVGSLPRRAASGDVGGGVQSAAAAAAGESGGGGGGAGASGTHYPLSRRRSVEAVPRSTSPANPAAAAAAAAAASPSAASGGGGGVISRSSTKWDFLDAPTGAATGGFLESSMSYISPPAPSGGSFTRNAPSLLDSAGSIILSTGMTLTGSFTSGSAFARRPSRDAAVAAAAAVSTSASGSFAAPEALGLTPLQLALLEAGLDPYLGAEASSPLPGAVGGGGGGGGGSGAVVERRGSVTFGGVLGGGGGGIGGSGGGGGSSSLVATLPALGPSGSGALTPPPRGLAPLTLGGGSPAVSAEFDGRRASGVATPFRSPNALTPSNRRSSVSGGVGLIPPAPSVPASLLDSGGYGSGGAGALLSPSPTAPGIPGFPGGVTPTAALRAVRASHCGTAGNRCRSDADGSGSAPQPAAASLTALPPALSPRVPALQALDVLEAAAAAAAPPSPGLYTRSARVSFTGGVTPRMSSMDSLWQPAASSRGGFLSGLRGRGATREGAGGGGAFVDPFPYPQTTEAEVEEEAALARSLVPKNQAGMFMVRGGTSSAPSKHAAARRIANCF